MTSGSSKSATISPGSPALMLEVASKEKPTPLLIPVLVHNLSMGGVTLAVPNPWIIADWHRYRGQDCFLLVENSPGQEDLASKIKAHITWSRFGDIGQPPLLLGVQLTKPATGFMRQLSTHLAPTAQDIKGLWDRYDQVQESPAPSNLVYYLYIAGLGLLIGGLLLQFTHSSSYQIFGWVLWFLGSLGIAGKVLRSFRQKRASQQPGG
jgi:hypothetical protein